MAGADSITQEGESEEELQHFLDCLEAYWLRTAKLTVPGAGM